MKGGGQTVPAAKPPHVLVLMMYWFPYEGPIPAIYATLFQRLMERGYRFSLVASFPHFRLGRKERWPEFKGKLFAREDWNGIDLHRVWVLAPEFRSRRLGLLFRALNYASFTVSSLVAGLIVSRGVDVILVPSSPPFLAAVNAWLIGRLRSIPFVYNIQDLYPENMRTLGMLDEGPVMTVLSRVENALHRRARTVTVISGRMKELLLAKGLSADKVEMIPNFHDTKKIVPLPKRNAFAREFGLEDRFVVSYIGGVSFTHGLEFVLEAAGRLRDEAGIRFMILGRGEHLPKIRERAEAERLDNVQFVPEQPYERMNEIWAASDVSLVCMRKGMSGFQVPSKTFGIMASGRPIIAMLDRDSEIWKIVEEGRGGICVEPERPDLLAGAVLDLFRDDERREKMGRRAREWVTSRYSEEHVVDAYDRVFRAANARGVGRGGKELSVEPATG